MDIKTKQLCGTDILYIKWQDSEQDPSIKVMAHYEDIFIDTEFGYAREIDRDNAWNSDYLLDVLGGSLLDLIGKGEDDE